MNKSEVLKTSMCALGFIGIIGLLIYIGIGYNNPWFILTGCINLAIWVFVIMFELHNICEESIQNKHSFDYFIVSFLIFGVMIFTGVFCCKCLIDFFSMVI